MFFDLAKILTASLAEWSTRLTANEEVAISIPSISSISKVDYVLKGVHPAS